MILLFYSSLASSMRLLYLIFASVCAVGVLTLALLPKPPVEQQELSDDDDDDVNVVEGRSNSMTRIVRSSVAANITTWKDEFREFIIFLNISFCSLVH